MVEFSLKINEQVFKVSPMKNLRVLLDEIGVQNFGLCHHEKIISAGKCDLCLVEVNGELVRSCEIFINSNIEVSTRTQRVEHGLKKSFGLLAKNHKTDCERCHQSGVCKIQNFARAQVISLGKFNDENKEQDKTELGNGYLLDHNRCVNCTICIDYSQKVAKDDLFFHYGRGEGQSVDFNKDSDNIGELWRYRDLCPTGAIAHADDLKIGERGQWHDVVCVGCDRACKLTARTIAKRFIDVRTDSADFQSCEAGRKWWRSLDLWRALSDISVRRDDGEMIPVQLAELSSVVPKNIEWHVLLPSDLSSVEVNEWAQSIKAHRLIANIFMPQRENLYSSPGPSEPYLVAQSSFELTSELLETYEGLIVVEPLWRFNRELMQEFKRRSKALVVFSSGPVIDNLSLVHVNRQNWPISPLLPARQSEALQGIIDVLISKE